MVTRLPVVFFLAAAIAVASVTGVRAGKPEFAIKSDLVRRLSPPLQRKIAGLQYLLNPYQLRQFFSLPTDSLRQRWIQSFWDTADPTPATPENEMRIEHEIRVDVASRMFANKQWPGWDRRGEIFIRYGSPDYRGKVHAEVTARKVHPPGELWFYRRHLMVIQFEDFNLNGRYDYAIKPLGLARDTDPELIEFLLYDTEQALQSQIPPDLLSFYRDPEIVEEAITDWTPLHETLYGVQLEQVRQPRLRGTTEGMDEIANPDTKAMVPNNPSEVFLRDRVTEYANNFEVVTEETPSSYPFNFEQNPVRFVFSVDQFRGGEGINRVEVNLELEARLTPGETGATSRTYKTAAVFWDAGGEEASRQEREIAVPTAPGMTDSVRLLPVQVLFSLRKSYYRMAVSVEEVGTDHMSAYRSTMPFNDYRYDLALSDILFASKIGPVERQSPFNRGALEVIPHPARLYRKGDLVPVYFEIYNLQPKDDGMSSYTVEYRIVPHAPQKSAFWDRFRATSPVISSRFESSCYGSYDQQYVSIGTENLWEGTFDFLVTAKDGFAQTVVYRKEIFRIID